MDIHLFHDYVVAGEIEPARQLETPGCRGAEGVGAGAVWVTDLDRLVWRAADPVAAPEVKSAGQIIGGGRIGMPHVVIGFEAIGEALLEYQWLRDGVEIEAATAPSFTPTSEDEDNQISRRTIVTNGAGSNSATTATVRAGYPEAAILKTWVSSALEADWATAASSPFVLYQSPWGMWSSNAGDSVLRTTARRAPGSPSPSMRTVTTEMPFGDGLPKGAPAIILGYHYDLTSPVNPFRSDGRRGLRSDRITSLSARVGGTDFSIGDSSYLQALQLYASVNREQAGSWNESDDHFFDIQVRSGSNLRRKNWPEAFMRSSEIVDLSGVQWKWKREITENQGAGTRSWTFEPVEPDHDALAEVELVDIIAFIVDQEVAAGSQDARHIWLYSVQSWVEPRAGTVDYSVHSFGVELNGVTYGSPGPRH
jgi:hypothetical protein